MISVLSIRILPAAYNWLSTHTLSVNGWRGTSSSLPRTREPGNPGLCETFTAAPSPGVGCRDPQTRQRPGSQTGAENYTSQNPRVLARATFPRATSGRPCPAPFPAPPGPAAPVKGFPGRRATGVWSGGRPPAGEVPDPSAGARPAEALPPQSPRPGRGEWRRSVGCGREDRGLGRMRRTGPRSASGAFVGASGPSAGHRSPVRLPPGAALQTCPCTRHFVPDAPGPSSLRLPPDHAQRAPRPAPAGRRWTRAKVFPPRPPPLPCRGRTVCFPGEVDFPLPTTAGSGLRPGPLFSAPRVPSAAPSPPWGSGCYPLRRRSLGASGNRFLDSREGPWMGRAGDGESCPERARRVQRGRAGAAVGALGAVLTRPSVCPSVKCGRPRR